MNRQRNALQIAGIIVGGIVVAFILLAVLTAKDNISYNRFCKQNPTECFPAVYSGKVVSK
jgi:hypothetical protein